MAVAQLGFRPTRGAVEALVWGTDGRPPVGSRGKAAIGGQGDEKLNRALNLDVLGGIEKSVKHKSYGPAEGAFAINAGAQSTL